MIDETEAPARGQHVVMLLAAGERRLAVQFGELFDKADLASNVPILILEEAGSDCMQVA